MKLVLQRVLEASVTVNGELISAIDRGLLILVGVAAGDSIEQAEWLAEKVKKLKIFEATAELDETVSGREILCVSQFTLCADTRKGTRPSWSGAAPPAEAEPLYRAICERLAAKQGVFGAEMQVGMVGDGPFTLILERLAAVNCHYGN